MLAPNLPILLLDIDGVIALEVTNAAEGKTEILSLHKNLGEMIAVARDRTFVVTHRSRREAWQILEACKVSADDFNQLVAAEDILRQAMWSGRIGQAVRRGLQKSLVLPMVAELSGCSRDMICLLDDRQHNLDAMLESGAGLAMKAPSAVCASGQQLTTFEMESVFDSLRRWFAERHTAPLVDVPSIERPIADWQKTGLSTEHLQRHAFNRARRLVYKARTFAFGRKSVKCQQPN